MDNLQMAKTNKEKLSPLKSIKQYCKHHCCCDDRDSWINCSLTNCFLFRYRFGRGKPQSIEKQQVLRIDSTEKGHCGEGI